MCGSTTPLRRWRGEPMSLKNDTRILGRMAELVGETIGKGTLAAESSSSQCGVELGIPGRSARRVGEEDRV